MHTQRVSTPIYLAHDIRSKTVEFRYVKAIITISRGEHVPILRLQVVDAVFPV